MLPCSVTVFVVVPDGSHVASETVPCAGRGDGVGRRRAAAGGAYFLKVTSDETI